MRDFLTNWALLIFVIWFVVLWLAVLAKWVRERIDKAKRSK